MYENANYYTKSNEQFFENNTTIQASNDLSNSNVNNPTQYTNFSNYYEPSNQHAQYNTYNTTNSYNYYQPYYSTGLVNNSYQYHDNKFYNNFQQFNNVELPQPQKSVSPCPNAQFAPQVNPVNDSTPEKQNDSGIDVISPQLTYNLMNGNQLYQQTYSSNSSNSAEIILPTSSIAETETDESLDDENESESDEFNESSKENLNEKRSKSSSKVNDNSKSSGTPSKPPKPYLEIIADAILTSKVKMMQLHEIYNYMENKYEYFFKNVNKSWRNSVRHNLSLNECFVKAGRGSNGKGNYWKIHPLCEKEFVRGCFRRKNFKQLIRAGSSQNNQHNNSNLTYNLPVDYALNFRSMVPPPLPQQFLTNNSANLSSFQYPVFNQEQPLQQQQLNNSYTSLNDSTTAKASTTVFHPYRI